MLEKLAADLHKKSLQDQSIAECRSTFDYARAIFLRARPWQLWISLLQRLRGVRIIAVTLRAITITFSALGNAIPLLIFTLLFLVILPLLLVWGCVWEIRAFAEQRRHKSFFLSLGEGRVYVLFPTEAVGAYQRQNIASLACRGKVILISPKPISSIGVYSRKRERYSMIRQEKAGVWLIRAYMLPKLRRQLRANTDAVWIF